MKELQDTKQHGEEKRRTMMLEFIIPLLENIELFWTNPEGDEQLLGVDDLGNFTNDQLWDIMKVIQVELEK